MGVSKKINLGVIGSSGKLGSLIVEAALKDPIFCMTLAFGRPPQKEGFFDSCEVLIDTSHPDVTSWLIDVLENGLSFPSLVIGTTGLSEETRNKIKLYAQKSPVVLDSNFSEGATALKVLSGLTANLLLDDWEVFIVDIHHKSKKDAPSGTALELLNHLPIGNKEIPTFTLRIGEVAGEHRVQFRKKDGSQKLSLQHKVLTRQCFAAGALQAAKWVVHQQAGVYSMQNVLGCMGI